MDQLKPPFFAETLLTGAAAGTAGGLAEVVWIGIYGAVTGTPTEAVARGIVVSVAPTLGESASAPWFGLLIHQLLAIFLGVGLAVSLRLLSRKDNCEFELGLVIFALLAVWAINFLVVLPYLNPNFVHVLPYGVTLMSKLAFGLSAATVLGARRGRKRRTRAMVF